MKRWGRLMNICNQISSKKNIQHKNIDITTIQGANDSGSYFFAFTNLFVQFFKILSNRMEFFCCSNVRLLWTFMDAQY